MNATLLTGLAAVPLLLYFGAGAAFYRLAVARTKKGFLDTDPSLPASSPDADLNAWWNAQPKTEERIRSADGLGLAADWLPFPAKPSFAAVLVHGYTGTGPTMKRYARLLRERFDCDLLAPDLRGHGRSDGGYIGFGLRDAEDLRLWIDWLIERRGPDIPIILYGVSMGGAAVLTAAGSALPTNVRCVVSDCGYSDAREILAHKAKKLYGLPRFPAVAALRSATALLARYDLAEACPRRAVARTKLPILFIHGDADDFVPPRMAEELFSASGGAKELYLVTGAGHAQAYQTAGAAYAERVAAFIAARLQPESASRR